MKRQNAVSDSSSRDCFLPFLYSKNCYYLFNISSGYTVIRCDKFTVVIHASSSYSDVRKYLYFLRMFKCMQYWNLNPWVMAFACHFFFFWVMNPAKKSNLSNGNCSFVWLIVFFNFRDRSKIVYFNDEEPVLSNYKIVSCLKNLPYIIHLNQLFFQ